MSKRLRFVVPGDEPAQVQGSAHLSRLEPYGDVTVHTDLPKGPDQQLSRVREADVVLNTRGAVRWPAELLRQLPRLRLITLFAIGTDSVDLAAARELGIAVCNVPGRTAPLVAEHALALLLACARRIVFQTDELRAGRWRTKADYVYLGGKTLGVIGTGHIGACMVQLGRGIGMRVLAWTFHPSPERATALGVEFVELDNLLRQADAVSLHLKLTDASRGLIGRRELALMKPGAILVNTGRGAVVDQAALASALDSGHLGGAGLDVFEQEPLAPDDPILHCRNVALTPHDADSTPEGLDFLNEGAIDNTIAFLEGRPQNLVT
jgi:D-3-phosphoglycerate dehydrogenase